MTVTKRPLLEKEQISVQAMCIAAGTHVHGDMLMFSCLTHVGSLSESDSEIGKIASKMAEVLTSRSSPSATITHKYALYPLEHMYVLYSRKLLRSKMFALFANCT